MASESAYLHDLLHDDESDPGHRPDLAFDANSFCSDGRDDFSLLSSEDNDRDSISEGSSESHDDVRASGGVQAPSEIAFSQDITKKNDSSGPGNENGGNCEGVEEEEDQLDNLPTPKGKSIVHHHIQQNKLSFLSFDIETGGEFCGIVQMSGQVFRFVDGGDRVQSEQSDIFNKYVRPPDGAIWDTNATQVHGLTASSDEIKNANGFTTVWQEFCEFIRARVSSDESCVLVAYNGETCDMKWIYKLVQAPNTSLSFPRQIKFFMDPLKMIKHYKSCPLHPSKSKLESLRLDIIYRFVTGTELQGAHNSLNDVRAQTTIVTSNKLRNFIDKSISVSSIDDIFSRQEKADILKTLESIRPVHEPWMEINATSDNAGFSWSPSEKINYTGPEGGPPCGPTDAVLNIARSMKSIASIFFFIFPLSLFEYIANMSEKYAYKEWVVEKTRTDPDGVPTKKPFFQPVFHEADDADESKHPIATAFHRADKEPSQYPITQNSVIAWIGILLISSAHFTDNRNQRNIWMNAPYGVSIPYIQNTMTRRSFEFLRRYIHFCDNKEKNANEKNKNNPLFKVSYVMDKLMDGLRRAWNAGEKITIDESMIKYCGRAVAFVQYMPAKPIKHGIKVFAVCCAFTAVLLGFETYVGAGGDEVKSTAVDICCRLVEKANLTHQKGRIVYTDNWYTSILLAKTLFEKYRWRFCGTMKPTDKKARSGLDVPFVKLSNGALREVNRGWFREAVVKQTAQAGKEYYIQCSTWRDKKQVMFIHTNQVRATYQHTVQRSVKGKRRQVTLSAPQCQHDYAENFNAVDRNDRDSADYTASIRTSRWYLRLFCWLLDRVVHMTFVIVCFIAKSNVNHFEEWKKYATKNGGRHKFQVDLGIVLVNHAIKAEWTDLDKPRPKWMRQAQLLPCECNKCFFCVNKLTNGIHHKESLKVIVYHSKGKYKTNKCTEERIALWSSGSYCRQCYRNMPKGMDSKEKRRSCKTSKMGCPSCWEPICNACWENGYDQH